jgi:Recombinase
VIAEYERAKIAERYRRGKLFRSRNGEVLAWRVPYGYRRRPRDAHGPARLEAFEPEAAIVRRIFHDYVHGGHSLREIIRRLAADQIPPPTGRDRLWRPSTLSNLLRHEAYIRRIYANRTEAVPDPRPGKRSRQVSRPREDWIAIAVPAILDDQTFEAAGRVSRDNSQWSPRRAEPGQWLLRGLVKCGICQVGVNCHKRRGRDGIWNRYYPHRNTAATTTRSKPAGTTGAAPNATSAPTPSTRSCSTRSAPPCCAPTCSPPANRRSPCAPPPPTTNCSPPNWPAWTANSTPPMPNAAASSTSTRPVCSSYPSCNAAPPRSSTAAATWTNAATPSLPNVRS